MSSKLTDIHSAEFASGTAKRAAVTAKRLVEVRLARASVLVSVVLLAVKFIAYWLTGSAAIFSDALESVVNVAAAVMAVWALSVAHRPADRTHPYGHGKAEFISAALEGGMILLAAVAASVKAVDVLLNGGMSKSANLDLGLWLMVAALVANGLMGSMLLRVGRRNGSIALEADGRHLFADALTSAIAVTALVIVKVTGKVWVDPVAALVVTIWIVLTGARLIRRSVAGLMDETDIQDDALLRHILDSHMGSSPVEPMICGYHKLRHRHNGRYHWVDFHMVVPRHWDIAKGHQVASQIEFELETALGEGNATAHVEPCDHGECLRCDAKI
jgi:cation diffusion facilitator family transporter